MGFVDVEQGFSRINASYVDHPVDVGAVAVHAVYAFGDYQDCIEIGSLAGDDLRAVVVVIVAETLEWSPGKAYAVDYARVDEAVGNDECATVGDGLNESDVGMVAAVESQGGAPVRVGKRCFERVKIALSSAEQSRGRRTHR